MKETFVVLFITCVAPRVGGRYNQKKKLKTGICCSVFPAYWIIKEALALPVKWA